MHRRLVVCTENWKLYVGIGRGLTGVNIPAFSWRSWGANRYSWCVEEFETRTTWILSCSAAIWTAAFGVTEWRGCDAFARSSNPGAHKFSENLVTASQFWAPVIVTWRPVYSDDPQSWSDLGPRLAPSVRCELNRNTFWYVQRQQDCSNYGEAVGAPKFVPPRALTYKHLAITLLSQRLFDITSVTSQQNITTRRLIFSFPVLSRFFLFQY
jgi:hypothetical protein